MLAGKSEDPIPPEEKESLVRFIQQDSSLSAQEKLQRIRQVMSRGFDAAVERAKKRGEPIEKTIPLGEYREFNGARITYVGPCDSEEYPSSKYGAYAIECERLSDGEKKGMLLEINGQSYIHDVIGYWVKLIRYQPTHEEITIAVSGNGETKVTDTGSLLIKPAK